MPNPHQLTREQMHEIIDRGESVMLPDGRICTQKHHLPSEGDIALMTGDSARQGNAMAQLRADIDAKEAELKRLEDAAERQKEADEAAAAAAKDAPASQTTGPGPAPVNPAAPQTAVADEKARERQELLTGGAATPAADASKPAKPAK